MASGYPDFEGAKSKLFSAADWSAVAGTDKNFTFLTANKTFGVSANTNYVVPAGKTLYITGFSFVVYANAQADGDLNQMGYAYIKNQTDGTVFLRMGGNGGGSVELSKPISFAAGKEVRFYISPQANHACDIGLSAWGYEI